MKCNIGVTADRKFWLIHQGMLHGMTMDKIKHTIILLGFVGLSLAMPIAENKNMELITISSSSYTLDDFSKIYSKEDIFYNSITSTTEFATQISPNIKETKLFEFTSGDDHTITEETENSFINNPSHEQGNTSYTIATINTQEFKTVQVFNPYINDTQKTNVFLEVNAAMDNKTIDIHTTTFSEETLNTGETATDTNTILTISRIFPDDTERTVDIIMTSTEKSNSFNTISTDTVSNAIADNSPIKTGSQTNSSPEVIDTTDITTVNMSAIINTKETSNSGEFVPDTTTIITTLNTFPDETVSTSHVFETSPELSRTVDTTTSIATPNSFAENTSWSTGTQNTVSSEVITTTDISSTSEQTSNTGETATDSITKVTITSTLHDQTYTTEDITMTPPEFSTSIETIFPDTMTTSSAHSTSSTTGHHTTIMPDVIDTTEIKTADTSVSSTPESISKSGELITDTTTITTLSNTFPDETISTSGIFATSPELSRTVETTTSIAIPSSFTENSSTSTHTESSAYPEAITLTDITKIDSNSFISEQTSELGESTRDISRIVTVFSTFTEDTSSDAYENITATEITTSFVATTVDTMSGSLDDESSNTIGTQYTIATGAFATSEYTTASLFTSVSTSGIMFSDITESSVVNQSVNHTLSSSTDLNSMVTASSIFTDATSNNTVTIANIETDTLDTKSFITEPSIAIYKTSFTANDTSIYLSTLPEDAPVYGGSTLFSNDSTLLSTEYITQDGSSIEYTTLSEPLGSNGARMFLNGLTYIMLSSFTICVGRYEAEI